MSVVFLNVVIMAVGWTVLAGRALILPICASMVRAGPRRPRLGAIRPVRLGSYITPATVAVGHLIVPMTVLALGIAGRAP